MANKAVGLPAMLRALRASKGWSQAELSTRTGIRQRLISDYELGKLAPRLERARRLADAYGVTVDSFFGDSVQLPS